MSLTRSPFPYISSPLRRDPIYHLRPTPRFTDLSRIRLPLIILTPRRTPATTRTAQPRTAPNSQSASSADSLFVMTTRIFATTASPAGIISTRITTSTDSTFSTIASFAIPRPGAAAPLALLDDTASPKNDASWKRSTTLARSGSKHNNNRCRYPKSLPKKWFRIHNSKRVNRNGKSRKLSVGMQNSRRRLSVTSQLPCSEKEWMEDGNREMPKKERPNYVLINRNFIWTTTRWSSHHSRNE